MPNRGLELLSITGSTASILALVVVLVQMAAGDQPDEQKTVWQIILAFISLTGAGGVAALAWYLIGPLLPTQPSPRKVVQITLRMMACLILLGAALDGVVASVRWRMWLNPLWKLLLNLFR